LARTPTIYAANEEHNIADEQPDRVAAMLAEWNAWWNPAGKDED